MNSVGDKILATTVDDQEQRWPNQIEEYNLLDLIGSGSFGRVFRAYCKQNAKECAIKCIPKRTSPNLDKILSEVYIHIRLNHPNVLQLFTVLEDLKAVYLIMEMCHGGSLSQFIATKMPKDKCDNAVVGVSKLKPILPYEMISSLILQICDALEYLHRNSIVHRDINLNNILLVKPFDSKSIIQIKLADFGLAIDKNVGAYIKDSLFGTTICGTPGFISPEVWNQKQNASYKSDIFSLGSIVYACITGHTPKGDIDLSLFFPMTANLIAQLLNHDPKQRPELEQIKQHIFVSGRIDTERLFPIEKTTNTLKMSIDQAGNAEMYFIKDNISIKVVKNGSLVHILQNNISCEYNFYELPEKYWKRFLYVTKFVKLVKSKTSKITINCFYRLKQNQFDKEYINKCVLMANGDFEITLHNEILCEDSRFLLKNVLKSDDLKKYKFKLIQLYSRILHIEQELENVGQQIGMNFFPVTLGMDSRLLEQKRQNLTENNSFLTSKILRSMPVNGIGHVIQFTNGSIKVNFNDGSDLCMDRDDQIFYFQDGILKKFHKDQALPETVVEKLARLPQVIEYLKISKMKH